MGYDFVVAISSNSDAVSLSTDHAGEFDLENLQDEVKRRVALRREHGLYPVGMEHELEKQFKYLTSLGRRLQIDHDRLRLSVEKLQRSVELPVPAVSRRSKWPFGSFVHRVIQNSARRMYEPEKRRTDGILASMLDVLNELCDALSKLDALERKKSFVLSNEVLSRLSLLDNISSRLTDLESRPSPNKSRTSDE